MLATIANALKGSVEEICYMNDLAELEDTPDKEALIAFMPNGKRFQIDVTELV
jgi:hypothetical protein